MSEGGSRKAEGGKNEDHRLPPSDFRLCMTFDRVWYWRKRLPERKGQRCRIIARGSMNSCLVEFEDGFQVVTSRFAVRKAAPQQEA